MYCFYFDGASFVILNKRIGVGLLTDAFSDGPSDVTVVLCLLKIANKYILSLIKSTFSSLVSNLYFV